MTVETTRPPYADLLMSEPTALARHPFASWKEQYKEPVQWFEEGKYWVITGHAAVTQVMRDTVNVTAREQMGEYSSRTVDKMIQQASEQMPGYEPLDAAAATKARQVLLWSDGPRHAVERSLVANVVKPRKIVEWVKPFPGIADELLKPLVGRGEVNFRDEFALPFAMRAIMSVLGFPFDEEETVTGWSHDFVKVFGAALPDEEIPQLARSRAEFGQFLDKLIEDRRQNPKPDLLSDVIAEYDRQNPDMSRIQLHTLVQEMFVGGNETAANTLVNAVKRFGQDKELWNKLKADYSLVPQFLEEFLRVEAPVQGAFRHAKETFTVADVEIAKGDMMYVVFGSANFDETVFPNPAELDLERKNAKRHMSFGFGVHNCVGQNIAREELRLVIVCLLDACSEIKLLHEGEDTAVNIPSMVLRSPERLRVELVPAS